MDAKFGGCPIRRTCHTVELPRSTFYDWLRPRHKSVLPRKPANQLSVLEKQAIKDLLFDTHRVDQSIYQIHSDEANQGRLIASLRTFYRVAKDFSASGDRRPQAKHPKRTPPILMATSINQVWCWDVTRIPGQLAGSHMCLFGLIDLFSRFVVGWMLATKENAFLATHFLRESVRRSQQEGSLQHLVTHSDRGAPMVAAKTRNFLDSAGIRVSFSRPRVSDDNPFIEALFKTIKYNSAYPGYFDTPLEAESWLSDFVARYHQTPHKGLAGYTPHQAYTHTWINAFRLRQNALNDCYQNNSCRFAKPPTAIPLPNLVSINVGHINIDDHTKWLPPATSFAKPPKVHHLATQESSSTLIPSHIVSDSP